MNDFVLGPWKVGIDHVSSDTKVPTGAARDAVNGNFNREGEFTRRNGYTLLLAGTGLHSVWSSKETGWSFCGQGSMLCIMGADSSGALNVIPLLDTGSQAPLSFCDLDGDVIYANPAGIGRIRDGVAMPLAPLNPGAPNVVAIASGGLTAGRYGVGVSLLNDVGGESGLSELRFVDVPEGGGLAFAFNASSDRRLIYRTAPNGDLLYHAAHFPGALTSAQLGAGQLGRLAETMNLEPLPGGQIVRQWRGRTLVARGNILMFSEPMRYGLYSRREGFVQAPSRILMMEAVEGGIFVGTVSGVIFLQGSKPSELTVRRSAAQAPFEGSGLTVPGSAFNGAYGDSRVATWLAPNGFVIGTASGQIVETQANRIAIPDSGATSAHTFVHERRVTSIIQ